MSPRDLAIVLSELAQQDLEDILQYTLQTWGAAQMDIYAERLQGGISLLLANPALGRSREDWFEGCRIYQIEHHLIVYEIGDHDIRVARICHKRMDIADHL